jgi:hypothetical protein
MVVRVRGMLRVTAEASKRFLGLWTPATILALSGLSALGWGLHLMYPPLPYVILGAFGLGFGLWLAGVPLWPPRRRDG